MLNFRMLKMFFGCDPLQGSVVKKQKIVINVQMSYEKHRTKALKIAAKTKGVISVSVDAEKGHLVVIGVGIDSVHLTRSLRKKLDHAVIETVEEEKKPEEKTPEEKKPDEVKKIEYCYSYAPYYPLHYDLSYRY